MRWSYDDAANITGRRRSGEAESFQYTRLNRLVQAGEITYAYNRAGEVTEKQGPAGSTDYGWNGRGELVKDELSDGSQVTYGYDAFDRLVRRVKTPADGEVPPASERSVYIWHGRQVLAEYDESAQGELELYKEYFRAAGRLVAVKMHGFHGRREPGPEGFLHTKGGLMYYHTDRLGSPVAITDRHGEPVARYAWDAYGRAMAGVFEPYNSVGFSGKMRDGTTGLTYFGARWYDADSGRFMSRDPIRDGWNWYAYVGGDPGNYVDPWGESVIGIGTAAFLASPADEAVVAGAVYVATKLIKHTLQSKKGRSRDIEKDKPVEQRRNTQPPQRTKPIQTEAGGNGSGPKIYKFGKKGGPVLFAVLTVTIANELFKPFSQAPDYTEEEESSEKRIQSAK